MIASFLLSRTLVPAMAHLLLAGEIAERAAGKVSVLDRLHHRVERFLDDWRDFHLRLLGGMIRHARARWWRRCWCWPPWPGCIAHLARPRVLPQRGCRSDAPARTSARRHARGGDRAPVRRHPARDPHADPGAGAATPSSRTSACRSRSTWPGSTASRWARRDGEMLIQLAKEHRPTEQYMAQIRAMLQEKFPQVHGIFPAGRHRRADAQWRRGGGAGRALRRAATAPATWMPRAR